MRSLALVVTFALLPSVVPAGQAAPRTEKEKEKPPGHVTLTFAMKLFEQWTTAVRTHAAGTVDEPLKTVAGWPTDYVYVALRLASRSATVDTLVRGLSLHTDIAIVESVAETAPDGRGAVTLVDARETGHIRRSAHWPIARQIAAELAKPTAARPSERPRVAAWYRATAALMQEWRDLDLQGVHLEAGQTLFVDDPVLALYQGTLRQAFGDPRLQQYLRHLRSTGDASGIGLGRAAGSGPPRRTPARFAKATRIELGIAERELRRALTLDPALHEARIRLAHVLSALGDDRQAVEVVRPALEAPLPPFLEFYAALILGRSEEHLGRFAEAGAAYARAAARFPGAQSAEIGRSRVELAQGRAADALTILMGVVGPVSAEQPDPWPDYFSQHDPDAETLLAAWRAGVK